MTKWLLLCFWIKYWGAVYRVEPEFIFPVMVVESGDANNLIRFGPLGKSGKYIGPMGINKCFRKQWDIDDPVVNIAVGARALRGSDKRRLLKRYNAAFNEGYYRAVMALYRQCKRERTLETAQLGGRDLSK